MNQVIYLQFVHFVLCVIYYRSITVSTACWYINVFCKNFTTYYFSVCVYSPEDGHKCRNMYLLEFLGNIFISVPAVLTVFQFIQGVLSAGRSVFWEWSQWSVPEQLHETPLNRPTAHASDDGTHLAVYWWRTSAATLCAV